MMCGSVTELTESGRADSDITATAMAVHDAEGLWFLLSHRVDVDEADDEVADMIGNRSLLAELGREVPGAEEVGVLLLASIAMAPRPPPPPISSLLTLFGRVPERLRCSGGCDDEDGACSKEKAVATPSKRRAKCAFGELAVQLSTFVCSSASCEDAIGLKPICGFERKVDFFATNTGGLLLDLLDVVPPPTVVVVVEEPVGEVVPAPTLPPIEVVDCLRALAGFMSA